MATASRPARPRRPPRTPQATADRASTPRGGEGRAPRRRDPDEHGRCPVRAPVLDRPPCEQRRAHAGWHRSRWRPAPGGGARIRWRRELDAWLVVLEQRAPDRTLRREGRLRVRCDEPDSDEPDSDEPDASRRERRRAVSPDNLMRQST